MVKQLLFATWLFPRRVAIALVELYQMTLSPDHGPLKGLHPHGFCRHEITCSDYAKTMLRTRGLIMGIAFAFVRVLCCHPWKKPEQGAVRRAILGNS